MHTSYKLHVHVMHLHIITTAEKKAFIPRDCNSRYMHLIEIFNHIIPRGGRCNLAETDGAPDPFSSTYFRWVPRSKFEDDDGSPPICNEIRPYNYCQFNTNKQKTTYHIKHSYRISFLIRKEKVIHIGLNTKCIVMVFITVSLNIERA